MSVVGYVLFGFSFLEAVYQTALVLTTHGLLPDRRIGDAEKLFTGLIAIVGVLLFFVTAAIFTTSLVEGHFSYVSRRRRMDRKIAHMRNHFIVCGYGRIGRAVAQELQAERAPFIVIESAREREDAMRRDGIPYVSDDATDEAVLREAGIERARGLVSTLDGDAGNVYIVLTARSLKQDLLIVSRASGPAAERRLFRAGADRVVSPATSSGRHMALLALRPEVIDHLDVAGGERQHLRLEEILVTANSPSVGRPVGQVVGQGVPLVIRREDGRVLSRPSGSEVLQVGDLVVLLGDPGVLPKLEGS